MPDAEPNNYQTKQARFVFLRDADNGYLVGPDGFHYDTEAEAMYYGQLGLCGCGLPEKVHALLIDCLRQFEGEWETRGGTDGIEKIVGERAEIVAEFIAHFLNKCFLTEHGGSVYGSWLTERGKQFLECGATHDEVD